MALLQVSEILQFTQIVTVHKARSQPPSYKLVYEFHEECGKPNFRMIMIITMVYRLFIGVIVCQK